METRHRTLGPCRLALSGMAGPQLIQDPLAVGDPFTCDFGQMNNGLLQKWTANFSTPAEMGPHPEFPPKKPRPRPRWALSMGRSEVSPSGRKRNNCKRARWLVRVARSGRPICEGARPGPIQTTGEPGRHPEPGRNRAPWSRCRGLEDRWRMRSHTVLGDGNPANRHAVGSHAVGF